MLDDETYRRWTEAFQEGSYFEGSWKEGSSIRFLSTEPDGSVSGMYSTIKTHRPNEYLAIRHLGEIKKGKETAWPDTDKPGGEALETYVVRDKDGGCELLIELDSPEEYSSMFKEMWPKALAKLKELAEA